MGHRLEDKLPAALPKAEVESLNRKAGRWDHVPWRLNAADDAGSNLCGPRRKAVERHKERSLEGLDRDFLSEAEKNEPLGKVRWMKEHSCVGGVVVVAVQGKADVGLAGALTVAERKHWDSEKREEARAARNLERQHVQGQCRWPRRAAAAFSRDV